MARFDPRYLTLLAVAWPLAKAFRTRYANGDSATWWRFLAQLGLAAGLVALSLLMATGVDQHAAVAGAHQSLQRDVYVTVMLLIMIGGVALFGHAIVGAGGDRRTIKAINGYVLSIAAFVLVLGVADWFVPKFGIPGSRLSALAGGGLLVWLGAVLPQWFRQLTANHPLTAWLGATQVRILYCVLGGCTVLAGATGWLPPWW